MKEGDDILEHLSNLKVTFKQIHALSNEKEFKISDLFFKVIITSSLPPSWDNFTQAYIAEVQHHATCNPFQMMTSHKFIGVIKSEAKWHAGVGHPVSSTHTAFGLKGRKGKGRGWGKPTPSLLKCITNEVTQKVKDMGVSNVDDKCNSNKPYCKHCENFGHWTNDCHTWGKDQCTHCSKYNHALDDCYFKDKLKLNKKEKKKENTRKCAKNEVNEVNTAESDHSYAAIEEFRETSSRGITFDSSESGQYFNFNNKDVTNYSMNDKSTLYYDWLANSATTSHITNRCDIFVTYEPIQDTLITGIGDLQAQAEGRSDVSIYALYNGI
jgi:hypothetical protein